MIDDMVMRTIYLTPNLDTQLRQIAFDNDCSKSDLIRASVADYVNTLTTPGIPDKELKAAATSLDGYANVKSKLGVYRTLERHIPHRRPKTLTA